MEKQKILYQQARLHARGAAEMVLQMISASKGSKAARPLLRARASRTHTRTTQPGQVRVRGKKLVCFHCWFFYIYNG